MYSRLLTCIGTVIALTTSLNVSAGASAGTEVALFTPWSFVQKKLTTALTASTLHESKTVAASNWQVAPWTPHLVDLTWDYKTKLELVDFSPQAIEVRTSQLAVSIQIQHLIIDQVIEREIDGAILRVQIQADCGPITMTQSTAKMDARFAFEVQPKMIATRLQKFDLDWAPGSWQVNDFECRGPIGFDQRMKDEFVQELKSAEKVRPFIEPMVAGWVQEKAAGLVTQMTNPIPVTIEKNNMVIQFRQMEGSQEGILNRGVFVWNGNPGQGNVTPLGMAHVPDSVAKRGTPTFISPSEGWTNLIAFLLQKRPATYDINMKTIKAFNDLLGSPSQQSAVWPDLQNYSTSSRFNLSVNRPRSYSLAWNGDGTANVQSPASATIQSVRGGRNWNYIALSGSVTGKLSPSISGGKLNASVKFSKSRFTPRFDPGYVQTYNANTTLDARVLDAFSQYVNEGFTYSAALQEMDLGFAGKGYFTSWTGISKDLIGMTLDLK